MRATPRTARFVTVIAVAYPTNVILCRGELRGVITNARLGDQGFGYDPIFVADEAGMTLRSCRRRRRTTLASRSPLRALCAELAEDKSVHEDFTLGWRRE